jgi:hypothetical protein
LRELPDGLENQIFGEFGFKSISLNYLYRPDDQAEIDKNPLLKDLPSRAEAWGKP